MTSKNGDSVGGPSTTVRVMHLIPGDVVQLPGRIGYATFVTQLDHPRYPGLRQVVWRLEDGSWSFDALDPRQVAGERDDVDQAERVQRLREVLGTRRSLVSPEIGPSRLGLRASLVSRLAAATTSIEATKHALANPHCSSTCLWDRLAEQRGIARGLALAIEEHDRAERAA